MSPSLRYLLNTPNDLGDDQDAPMVVVMHGRGADAADLYDLAPAIDRGRGYRYIFPNAPKPWEAAPGMTVGFTWFDGWPPVGSSLVESRKLLLEFVDSITEKYPTPPGKLVIAGFSQGGLMSLDAGLRYEKPLAGVVAMSGGLFEEDLAHLRSRKDLPVLLVHGTVDEVVPVKAARRARHVLEEHGLQPEYHEFPMAHQVTAESIDVVADFIHRCLG